MQSTRKPTTCIAHAALGIYLVSMALPAILDNDVTLLGFMAAYFAVFGLPSAVPHTFEGGESTAIVLGGLANLLIVFTYFGLLLRRYSNVTRPAYWTCAIAAFSGFAAAVTCIIPLLFVTETSMTVLGIATVTEQSYRILIGFYVWAVAAALLAYHSYRAATRDRTGDKHDERR